MYGYGDATPSDGLFDGSSCYTLTFVNDSTASGKSFVNSLGITFHDSWQLNTSQIIPFSRTPSLFMTKIGEPSEATRYTAALSSLLGYTCSIFHLKLYYNTNLDYLLYVRSSGQTVDALWVGQTPVEAVQEVAGLSFSYSLLNESGEASNRFKVDEIISFRFSMLNLTVPDSLYYEHNLLRELSDHGFGRVISMSNDTTDLPVISDDMLLYKPFFGKDNSFEAVLPVNYTALPDQPYRALPPGQYYTELTHTFKFKVGNNLDAQTYTCEPVTLRINFVIEE
jgi:hypothetical protein